MATRQECAEAPVAPDQVKNRAECSAGKAAATDGPYFCDQLKCAPQAAYPVSVLRRVPYVAAAWPATTIATLSVLTHQQLELAGRVYDHAARHRELAALLPGLLAAIDQLQAVNQRCAAASARVDTARTS